MKISTLNYKAFRNRGMSLSLDIREDRSTLTIKCNGQKVEVRGSPAIGTIYEGSALDRIIDALPKELNISALFADEQRHISGKMAQPIVDALEFEDELQRRLFSSKMKV